MNTTIALLRYAAVEGKGWRRGAAVYTSNGKLKPDVMMLSSVEVPCPNGKFQLRRYQDTRPVYVDLGNDTTDVLARFRAESSKMAATVTAVKAVKAAGLELVTTQNMRDKTDKKDSKTLRRYAAEFVAMHLRLPHRSDDSVRVYEQITSTFTDICPVKFPHQITKDHVIAWHSWMRKTKGYSDRTCAGKYQSLRGFLRYCGLNPDDIIPSGVNKLLKAFTKKKKPNTYTPEVIGRLIKASTDDNRALLWDFAYKTGLRDSELRAVTRHDLHGLDTDEPILHVKERGEYGNIKDAEERTIELHQSLVPTLTKWMDENPEKILLFGTQADLPDTKMLKALKVTARRAGLNCGRCEECLSEHNECREYTLHRFRRTYTTRMLRASNGDLRSVMERTGHADLSSIMLYLEPATQIRTATNNAF